MESPFPWLVLPFCWTSGKEEEKNLGAAVQKLLFKVLDKLMQYVFKMKDKASLCDCDNSNV